MLPNKLRNDPHGHNIAEKLIDCFNKGSDLPLADLCDQSLIINSSLLGVDQALDSIDRSPLITLVAACHSTFPGVRLRCEEINSSEAGFSFIWRGQFNLAEKDCRLVDIQGNCKIRIARSKISEIWFAVDAYSTLLQLGRISSDPGKPKGRAAEVNHLAANSLRQAIIKQETVGADFTQGVIIHANIEIYKNLEESLGTKIICLEGSGKIDDLVASIRHHLGIPVDLTFRDGISQGYTTTFRGKIRAKVGTGMQRYNIVFGFISPGDQLAECWVQIKPPATLAECLM